MLKLLQSVHHLWRCGRCVGGDGLRSGERERGGGRREEEKKCMTEYTYHSVDIKWHQCVYQYRKGEEGCT